jgi:hypothetical protein
LQNITGFSLYPANRVSGRGPAGLEKPTGYAEYYANRAILKPWQMMKMLHQVQNERFTFDIDTDEALLVFTLER